MSNNNSISTFFDGHIAADDSIQLAMLGAEEQRAVAVERFGGAPENAVTDVDDHVLAERGAMLLRRGRNRGQAPGGF